MKKVLLVPAVAMLAAAGAASAAGFAGGVSAGPVQSGDAWNLTCAGSARVVEWGTDDSKPVPTVDNALIKLSDSHCQGQAVYLIALKPDGSELARFASTRLNSGLASGDQYVRVAAPTGGIPVSQLNAIRITVDPGYPGMPGGGANSRY